MKKFSLFLSAMLISMMSFAGTVTFDVAVDKSEIATADEVSLTKDGVTLHVSQGILGNGTNYRIYKGQWIDVSCEYGNITSVEFTCIASGTTKYGPGCFEYRGTAGAYTYDGSVGTWTGNEEKVTLYATSNQVRATKIVVTYESSDANFVSKPVIAGELDFADAAEVTITADEGMKIYYTLDGNDPTTASAEYTAPFEVTATTTVKAIAYNETTATASDVATVVFKQATKVTCAEAAAIAVTVSGNSVLTEEAYCVVGYVTDSTSGLSSGQQRFWVADTKDGGKVLHAYYCNVPYALSVGTKVQMVGKLTKYYTGQEDQPQMKNGNVTILEEPAPEPVMFTVTATAENGTVEGAGEYAENAEATLTATAAEGYEFVNWTSGETEVSTANPFTFTVTSDTTLVANFEEAAPATETVYFVNAQNWGAVNAYVWDAEGNNGGAWPGVAATKEAEQIGGYDVYSYTAEAGKYANVIFNGTGGQTADLKWTAGKYYVKDGWYTKEEAEAKLAKPVEYESVYFVNAQGWAKVNIYTWTPEVGGWPGVAMTKEAEQLAGYDVYSYTVEKGTAFGGMLFNNTTGDQTGDLKWTAGKYYVKDGWYTKEEAINKLSEPLDPVIEIAGTLISKDWAKQTLTLAEDKATASIVLTLVADSVYEFKLIADGTWLGNDGTMTRENCTGWVFDPAAGNAKITADAAGEYTFVYTLADKKLSVTYPALPEPEPAGMVGIVKRAVQLGESTIVLTHEGNVAHLYNVKDGVITEISQEGVVAIDPDNKGSYLAISDIAVTEDGKLVANNYVRCQFGTTAPETGYKKGTSYYYIWNDIAGAPSVWFTSQVTARSVHGDVGYTFALKGTSQNAEILVTAVHNNNRAVRMSLHKVIDGVYVDPDYVSVYTNDYYINFGDFSKNAYYIESAQGKQFQLNASATAGKWYLEGELSEPTEFMVPGVGEDYSASGLLADGTLGKKFNGATILSAEDTEVMVAPYADADGKLAGVKILDITDGLAAAEELQVLALEAPVEATAAATAVEIPEDEDAFYIYLVADNTIHTLKAEIEEEEVIEYTDMDLTVSDLVVDFETFVFFGTDDTYGIEISLIPDASKPIEGMDMTFGLAEGSSIVFGIAEMEILDGQITIDTETPAANAIVAVKWDDAYYRFNIAMTKAAAVVVEVAIEGAEVAVDDAGVLNFAKTWTYNETVYPVSVRLSGFDAAAGSKEYAGPQVAELQIGGDGDDDPWLDWAVADLANVTIDGENIKLEGTFKSYATGASYNLVITGVLPKSGPQSRAWAYDLKHVAEGENHTFSFSATTDATATLIFADAEGAELATVELGEVKAGANSKVLAASELPQGKKVTWSVKLAGDAIAEIVELTDASSTEIYNYYLPQDVKVNNNPESPYFGYVYVAAGTDGKTDGGSDRADNQKRGIFVYNQLLEEMNPESNVGILPANAAALMTDVSRQALHRMAVNPVNGHVAFAYNVEGATAVWCMDPANLAGDAVNLIEGLAITMANSICFDEDGVLYVLDNANTSTGGTIVKVVDGALVTVAQNAIWGNQDNSIVSDGRGGLWIAQNRWNIDTYAVLSHVNAAGEVDFAVTGSSPDEVKALFPQDANASYRGQCAYNAAEDILAFGGNKVVSLFQVTYDATTGVPSIAKLHTTPTLGSNIDGISFDYAGDLYVVSASSERFYKFAIPTENNVTIVPAAANQAFEIVEPTVLNPFAYALSSTLSGDATMLTVNYSLNANATSVNVLVLNGEEVVKTVPCAGIHKGTYTVEIPTEGLPTEGELTWSVEVNGTSVDAPTLDNKIYSFFHPSSVDIDINPENETFGMLLVNEGMHSVKDKTEGYVSAQFGAGIFAFTPSFDLIPNGELPGYNGGIEFTTTRADGTGTAYSPRRIRISDDGRIFVTSLNTDGTYLWEVNPENMNEWTPVFQGTLNEDKELMTSDSAFIVGPNSGFDVKGSGEDLQLMMYSVNLKGITGAAMGGFKCAEYNLGTATTWATAPSKMWVEGKYAINYTGTQVVYDNEGGIWIASYRGTASDNNPGLVHINANGEEDLKLVWNNIRQAGIRFNHDFTKLIVAGNNGAAKKATVYAVSADENGVPVLTEETVIDMAVVGNNLNDFAWDYAGNLYACGNSAEKIAAWAMPYSGQVVTPAASKYAFTLAVEPEYAEFELPINNSVFDAELMAFIGSNDDYAIEVMLIPDMEKPIEGEEMTFGLSAASTFTREGSDAEIIEGVIAIVDAETAAAEAIVAIKASNGDYCRYYITMTQATAETIEIQLVGAEVAHADGLLTFTSTWTYEDVEYPISVKLAGVETLETKDYEGAQVAELQIGGDGDDDPWLDWAVADWAEVVVEGETIMFGATFTSFATGTNYEVMITTTIPSSGLGDITVKDVTVKMIENGKLVIIKNGVKYNVQGAVIQ